MANSKKIKVGKKTAQKLRESKINRAVNKRLKSFLHLLQQVKPTVVEGRLVYSAEDSKRLLLVEIYKDSIATYADYWKKLATLLDNPPDGADDIAKALQQKSVNFDDALVLEEIEAYSLQITAIVQKINQLKKKLDDIDKQVAEFKTDTVSGSDLIIPEDDVVDMEEELGEEEEEEGDEEEEGEEEEDGEEGVFTKKDLR